MRAGASCYASISRIVLMVGFLRETTEAGESGAVLESEGEYGTLSKNFRW